MKLTIKVTKEVLERAKYCNSKTLANFQETGEGVGNNCAIALAIRDIFPYIWITKHNICFYKRIPNALFNLEIGHSRLPDEASSFIESFDGLGNDPETRVKMDPIEFDIDVPDAVIATVDIDEIRKLLVHHPTISLYETA